MIRPTLLSVVQVTAASREDDRHHRVRPVTRFQHLHGRTLSPRFVVEYMALVPAFTPRLASRRLALPQFSHGMDAPKSSWCTEQMLGVPGTDRFDKLADVRQERGCARSEQHHKPRVQLHHAVADVNANGKV